MAFKTKPQLAVEMLHEIYEKGILPFKYVVKERSARIMPENAIVTNETVEKRIALPIGWVPGYIPSMIIGIP